MWGDDYVVATDEWRADGRLGRHHIKGRARKLPGVEGPSQGCFVDDGPASSINYVGGRLHLAEGVRVEQAARLRQERRVDRHEVRLTEQLRKLDPLHAFSGEDLRR